MDVPFDQRMGFPMGLATEYAIVYKIYSMTHSFSSKYGNYLSSHCVQLQNEFATTRQVTKSTSAQTYKKSGNIWSVINYSRIEITLVGLLFLPRTQNNLHVVSRNPPIKPSCKIRLTVYLP